MRKARSANVVLQSVLLGRRHAALSGCELELRVLTLSVRERQRLELVERASLARVAAQRAGDFGAGGEGARAVDGCATLRFREREIEDLGGSLVIVAKVAQAGA